MKKIILSMILLSFIPLNARPWRPGQIPNGSKFSCANCHVDPNGGGPRNKFGQEVEKLVSVGGTEEFWSAALALKDSDLDGKTNGSELQDPQGVWRSGQPDPGTSSLVTNPGDQNSVAISTNNSSIPSAFVLSNNYPNPFNPLTTINYSLPRSTRVSIYVYDLLGHEVTRLADNEPKSAGNYTVRFNGEMLPSGAYFYRIETAEYVETKKMILLK